MITIYTNHDRGLVFQGTVEEAKAAGIRLHPDTREVTVAGKRRIVLNSATEPGHLLLWVTD